MIESDFGTRRVPPWIKSQRSHETSIERKTAKSKFSTFGKPYLLYDIREMDRAASIEYFFDLARLFDRRIGRNSGITNNDQRWFNKGLCQDPEVWEYLDGIVKESSESLNRWTVIEKCVCSEKIPSISNLLDISKTPDSLGEHQWDLKRIALLRQP
jgi:hypothetical protein